jgi:hypothetical protein
LMTKILQNCFWVSGSTSCGLERGTRIEGQYGLG